MGQTREDSERVIPLICTWLNLGRWWLPELILAGLLDVYNPTLKFSSL